MKFIFLIFALFLYNSAQADTLMLSNLNKNATGTSLGGGHYGLDISGTISSTNPANGNTGSAVPTQATLVGGRDPGGLLKAVSVSSTGVVFIDGSAVTQPVSAASLPLPTGASTSALQTSGNSSLTSIDGKTPSLGQALSSASVPVVLPASQITTLTPLTSIGINAGTNLIGKVGIDQTTPGTTNGVVVNSSALPSGASTSAKQPAFGTAGSPSADVITVQGSASGTAIPVSSASLPLPSGASTSANQSTEITSLASIVTNTTGASTAALQTTGNTSLSTIATNTGNSVSVGTSGNSPGSSTVSTVATLTAPSNCLGFVLMNLDTSSANIRWRVGGTATTASGQQLQPGRDTGFVPICANISIVSESGTQNYDVQYSVK